MFNKDKVEVLYMLRCIYKPTKMTTPISIGGSFPGYQEPFEDLRV